MALTSDQEHLDAVNAAIDATLTGKVASYSTKGRSLSRLPLKDLYEIRDRLEAKIARAAGKGVRLASLQRPR